MCGSITESGLVRLPGWDHRWATISVACLFVRCLPGCLTVLTRRQASQDGELLVLRHENAVLRRQAGRVRYQPAGRPWLAALSRPIPRCRRGEVFAVTPATLLAWQRRLVARKRDHASRRGPGRTPARQQLGITTRWLSWPAVVLGFGAACSARAARSARVIRPGPW
jgi:hypothetical protein